MITILGAGLAGLSCSYHLGHQKCVVFEADSSPGGHIQSHEKNGCIWDQGPHVSFTKNNYVKKLFEDFSSGDFLSYKSNIGNYYYGAWIPHPAQSNLFAVPEPLRSKCVESFQARNQRSAGSYEVKNYEDWLITAFGSVFSSEFPALYTKKYWTVEPDKLTTDWVGGRVFRPDFNGVIDGSRAPSDQGNHYIQEVRYPKHGGYFSYAKGFISGANIKTSHRVISINLDRQEILFSNGEQHTYEKLINTIPLPEFVKLCSPPESVRLASEQLNCTSLLLVNVVAAHKTMKPYHWMYVYDKDMLSTRVSCIEAISSNSVPAGKTALQVEVYGSRYKPFDLSYDEIGKIVCKELIKMGLVNSIESYHTQFIQYANVVFDHSRRESLDCILDWLSRYGLVRESDDLDAMTEWGGSSTYVFNKIALAGRFGQWKYFWSDDCVLRGRQIASYLIS